jgi:hypothetical protein
MSDPSWIVDQWFEQNDELVEAEQNAGYQDDTRGDVIVFPGLLYPSFRPKHELEEAEQNIREALALMNNDIPF